MNLSRIIVFDKEVVKEVKLQGFACSACGFNKVQPWLRKLLVFEDIVKAAARLTERDVFDLTHELCPNCSNWMDETIIRFVETESRGERWAKQHGDKFTVKRSDRDEFNRIHEEWLAQPEQQAKLKSGEAIIDHTKYAHMNDLVNVVEDDLTSQNRKIAPVSVSKSE